MTKRYVVHVAVIFPPDPHKHEYDLWELALSLSSDDVRQAIDRAISLSRDTLDEARSWSALGYSGKPILYGIKSVSSEVALFGTRSNAVIIPARITSLTEAYVVKLRGFDVVPFDYCLIHIQK